MLKVALPALLLCCLLGTLPPASAADQIVEMQTDKGPIVMRIYYSAVPYTAGNFLDLVERGFYNGLTFHRVESWCIQGGCPNGNGTGNYVDPGTGQPRFLKLEIHRGLSHSAEGIIAMARSQDPHSASCQFYILKAATPQLDGKYAIFGRVVAGMPTVFKIRPGDRILSAHILKKENPAKPMLAPATTDEAPARPLDPGF
ncbi:MAG: peptidylprolyl isomerase [Candidatus Obscuribacterales bacterium]|nr:peptidylprolyl isomerase [Candidatus Obscuribacterales bacterium]